MAHRFIRHPKLFRIFRLVHHKSHNPSSRAAYSFHYEATFEEVTHGKIVWLLSDKRPQQKVDNNNPDKSKQNQPIIGLIILKDFSFDSDEERWNYV